MVNTSGTGTFWLSLPWPPSVNHYWRRLGNRTLVSAEGRRYRQAAGAAVRLQVRTLSCTCRLGVQIVVHPPDRRERDLDNLLKAPLDALQYAGVYARDSQIDDLHIKRGSIEPGGELLVGIRELGG